MAFGLLSCYNLQPKVFTKDSSEEDLNYLRSRIYIEKEDVIVFKEIPLMTPFSCNFVFDCIDDFARKINKDFVLIIDLTEGSRPSSEVRKVLIPRFNIIAKRSVTCCFCVSKNILVKTALKFLLNMVSEHEYHIVTSMDDAFKIANEKLGG